MGISTAIEWCDSTVNPTMGCDGCELWSNNTKTCYAGVLHERYGGTNKGFSPKFEILTKHPGRMATAAAWSDLKQVSRPDKPWLDGMPRVIFVSDMSDALSGAIDFDYLKTEIIDVVSSPKGRRHVWMWLTKQPGRMAELSDWLKKSGTSWPINLWAGTSITSRATKARISHLAKVGDETTTRFISAEPLFEDIGNLAIAGIHLVICGGESGPGARPCDIDWIRSIVRQCKDARVKCFTKQLGAKVAADNGYNDGPLRCPNCHHVVWNIQHLDFGGADPGKFFCNQCNSQIEPLNSLRDSKGGDPAEWPDDLKEVREMPEVAR